MGWRAARPMALGRRRGGEGAEERDAPYRAVGRLNGASSAAAAAAGGGVLGAEGAVSSGGGAMPTKTYSGIWLSAGSGPGMQHALASSGRSATATAAQRLRCSLQRCHFPLHDAVSRMSMWAGSASGPLPSSKEGPRTRRCTSGVPRRSSVTARARMRALVERLPRAGRETWSATPEAARSAQPSSRASVRLTAHCSARMLTRMTRVRRSSRSFLSCCPSRLLAPAAAALVGR